MQGLEHIFPVVQSPEWKPTYYYPMSYAYFRADCEWFEPLTLRVEAVNGRFVEVKDAWNIAWKRREGEDSSIVEADVSGVVEQKI